MTNTRDSVILEEHKERSLYITRSEQWIQSPANSYVLSTVGNVMYGRFISGMPTSASISLANLMDWQISLESVSRAGFQAKLHAWESLTAEEISAIHEEFAEEDRALAEMGMKDYFETLKREEEV